MADDVLDTGIRELFNDAAQRPLLGRVLRAVQLDQGISYMDANELLREAAATALGQREPNLRGVLKYARGDADNAAKTLRLLEQRDAAVAGAYQSADTKLLDQGGVQAEPDRLRRARQLGWSYGGDDGRRKFFEHDSQSLEAGVDILRAPESQARLSQASGAAEQVARRLDQAIHTAGDRHQQVKALEAQIAELDGQRKRLSDQESTELRSLETVQPVDPGEPEARMLPSDVLAIYQRNRKVLLDAQNSADPKLASAARAKALQLRHRMLGLRQRVHDEIARDPDLEVSAARVIVTRKIDGAALEAEGRHLQATFFAD
jgi:hypothetical protein